MATENKRLNVNPILWSTADKTFVPASGEIWYYYETAGSILSVVGDGSSTVQELRDGAYINQVDNLGLSSGRTAFQELTSGTLNTSGWYTIAEVADVGFQGYSGVFTVLSKETVRETTKFRLSGATSNSSSKEIDIEMLQKASQDSVFRIESARIAHSNVTDSGVKIQIYINIATTRVITTQLSENIGDLAGLELVTPYLDNTPTLPDGVTTATFIEAGAELDLSIISAFPHSSLSGYKVGSDSVRCCVDWPDIPKQGTGLTITLPATALQFIDGQGNGGIVAVSHTVSNCFILGKRVFFIINQVGLATNLNVGPLLLVSTGAGFKLTITG